MTTRMPIPAALLAIVILITGFAPPLAAEPETARRIEMSLVVHPEIAGQSAWRGVVKQALTAAVADWEDLLGLRFVVGGESWWDPGSTGDLGTAVAALAGVHGDPSPSRIVLLVIPPAEAPDDDLLGYALLASPYMAVRFTDGERLALTIRHELGHVFGLPHLPGHNLMAESFEQRSRDLDAVAVDVLRAARGMDFAAETPFTGCDLEVIRDAYAVWAERGVGEPLLLRKLAEAFRASGRMDDAARCEAAADRLAR